MMDAMPLETFVFLSKVIASWFSQVPEGAKRGMKRMLEDMDTILKSYAFAMCQKKIDLKKKNF